MLLQQAWLQAVEYQDIHLIVVRNGINSAVSVTKKGSFANAIRQLVGFISDEEMLSAGWYL